MTTKHWMFMAVVLVGVAHFVLADDQPILLTPPAAAGPPIIPDSTLPPRSGSKPLKKGPARNAEKKTATKANPRSSRPDLKAAAVEPGPARVRQDHVNVRGRAAINSEVIAHLKKGEKVTVLEEITLSKPGTDEPDKWSKISLPSSVHIWVNTMFVDGNGAVKARKLNLRGGPGENYSVIGRVEKGTALHEIERKGDWIKIDPPSQAFAYVASHLLAKDVAAATPTTPANPPPVPPPLVFAPPPTSPVVIAPPVTPPPPAPARRIPPPVFNPPPPVFNPPPPVATPPPITVPAVVETPPPTVTPVVSSPVAAPPPPLDLKPVFSNPPPAILLPTNSVAEEEVFVKRVVTREGVVKRSVSIQAPTYFVLHSLDGDRVINYLHSSATNIMIKDFKNHRILVTGEEMLDERWPSVPVIEVETLEAVQ